MSEDLPIQLTSFVGRDRELVELGELLASTRHLTLTGTGGCGKTRLAVALATEAADGYPDGTLWLALAPISDPALVGSTLAAAVGVRPLPGQTSAEAAVSHLASRRALVLLDNCEHILEPCAVLAEALLRGCPEISIVATSREPLGAGGETTWRVPSLSLPADSTQRTPGGLERSDAVRLFGERAAKVRPDFELSNDNAAHVARICRDLDGIPLAIELAAARVRVLSVESIADGLADRFRLLTGGARGELPRLQTLRASVEWSHGLLEEPERVLLRRLSIFHGGFTLEACEAVCAGDGLDRDAVLDLLTSLVDKSLVHVDEHGSVSRYRLLETVRHYALERLTEVGEERRVRDRHAAAFLALAEGAAPSLGTTAAPSDALVVDTPNLYSAIDHASETNPDQALRLCIALSYWWLITGRLSEGMPALTRALDATSGERSPLRCSALFWRGHLAFFAADYALTRRDSAEALQLARELGDDSNEARVLNTVGLLETQPDPRASLPLLKRAAELARAAGDGWCMADARQNIGWALLLMGETEAAREEFDASYELARAHGLRDLIPWHWFMLGHSTHPTGDRQATRELWERSLEEASDLQHGMAAWSLSLLDTDAGEPGAALERLELCREQMVVAGVGLGVHFVDAGIALTHAALGRLEEARRVLTALTEEHEGGYEWLRGMALLQLAQVERHRGDGDAAEACAKRALAVAEHLGHAGLRARAHQQLARGAAAGQDWVRAEQLAQQALAVQAERSDHLDIPDSLDVLAEIAAGLESDEEAARLLGAADRARADLGLARWQLEQERADELAQRLGEVLGDEAMASATAAGQALSIGETIAYVRRARGERKRPSWGWESLTPTEMEVVGHLCEGLTNPEIGERMFISRGTVKVHLSHVYAKLGLRNRSEVAAEASRRRAEGDA